MTGASTRGPACTGGSAGSGENSCASAVRAAPSDSKVAQIVAALRLQYIASPSQLHVRTCPPLQTSRSVQGKGHGTTAHVFRLRRVKLYLQKGLVVIPLTPGVSGFLP